MTIDSNHAAGTPAVRGWLLYDGRCRFCTGWGQRLEAPLQRHGFALAALQEPWVQERLPGQQEKLLEEMRLLLPDGRLLVGVDSLLYAGRYLWWGWPFWLIGQVPPVRWVMRKLYRWFARNRYKWFGACEFTPAHTAPPPAAAPRPGLTKAHDINPAGPEVRP